MSYASGTTHYNLPQTVGSDKRDWTDTNQAFSDIDAAIYGAAQGASAATSAIETINGEIETITGKQAVDEGNISTLSGKVSTLESTVGTQAAAIADVRQDLQDNIESKREASATSTHAYNVGDYFYYNDILYKATASIAIGATIVPNTNCTGVTVMNEVLYLSGKKELAKVISDGTKTFTQLLGELLTALNGTIPDIIFFNNITYSLEYRVSNFSGDGFSATEIRTDSTGTAIIDSIILNNISSKAFSGTIGGTISDVSSTVLPSGVYFEALNY